MFPKPAPVSIPTSPHRPTLPLMLPQYNSGGPMDGHPTTPSPSANVGMSKLAHLLSRRQNQDCPSSSFYIYIFVCVCVCVCEVTSVLSL